MRTLTTIGNLRSLRALDRQSRLAPVRMGYMGDARLDAAVAMNDALAAHDYNKADQPLYMAYQLAAGLRSDGFPGQGTMTPFFADLKNAGIAPADVTVYPWRSSGAYDGTNAPASATWNASPPVAGPGFSAGAAPGTPTPATPGTQPGTLVLPEIVVTGGGTTPAPSTPAHPAVVAHAGGSVWPWVLGIAVAGGAAYGLARWSKKRRGGRTRTRTRTVIFA
jgi:hypothetical protein